jgi:hypothetical protein
MQTSTWRNVRVTRELGSVETGANKKSHVHANHDLGFCLCCVKAPTSWHLVRRFPTP